MMVAKSVLRRNTVGGGAFLLVVTLTTRSMATRKNWFGLRMKLLAWLAAVLGIAIAVMVLANSVLETYSHSVQQLFAQDYDSVAACQVMNESLERLLDRARTRMWDAAAFSKAAAEQDADVAVFEQKLAVQRRISDLPGELDATERLARAWAGFRAGGNALGAAGPSEDQRREFF